MVTTALTSTPMIVACSVRGSTVQEKQAIDRKDRDTAVTALNSNVEMRETVPREKQSRSANLEIAAWKFRLSASAAWE